MTESEAIKVLNMIETHGPLPTMAKEMSIKALEKQMKLNEMGDCYIIPKNGVFEVNGVDVNLAIQKQIPKKIVRVKLRPTEWGSGFRCPECEVEQTATEFFGYGKSDKKITFCWGCGQKLNWESDGE